MEQLNNKICRDCFKIKCRGCGWEPTKEEYQKVISGSIKACPECGRKP